jgi:hypothetical protein
MLDKQPFVVLGAIDRLTGAGGPSSAVDGSELKDYNYRDFPTSPRAPTVQIGTVLSHVLFGCLTRRRRECRHFGHARTP